MFGDPAPGGQGDVDVQDCHDNDRKIECCYSRPKRHCRVRKELKKKENEMKDRKWEREKEKKERKTLMTLRCST